MNRTSTLSEGDEEWLLSKLFRINSNGSLISSVKDDGDMYVFGVDI